MLAGHELRGETTQNVSFTIDTVHFTGAAAQGVIPLEACTIVDGSETGCAAAGSATLAASGGVAPYTWSLLSGPLPPGISVSPAGQVAGTPSTSGAFNFQVRVADSRGTTVNRALSIRVLEALAIADGEDLEGEAAASGSGDVIQVQGNNINSTIIIKSVVKDDQVLDLEKLPPEPGEPPYQGLQYFDERDANRFFGREQLTVRVIGRLQRARFLAVIGASGSGKSSLVRAGVIPALKSGGRLSDGSLPPPDSPHWAYRTFTPGGHPLDTLAAALSEPGALPTQLDNLRQELARSPQSIVLAISLYSISSNSCSTKTVRCS